MVICTGNMHLAEDCVRGECDVNIVGFRILYNVLIDRMLGTSVEAQWSMGAWVHYVKSAFAVKDTSDRIMCVLRRRPILACGPDSRVRVTSKVSRVLLSQQLKAMMMNDAGVFGSGVFEVGRGVFEGGQRKGNGGEACKWWWQVVASGGLARELKASRGQKCSF